MSGSNDRSGTGTGGTGEWPVTDLDAVQRMRVLASALPSGAYGRLHIEAPFEQVWGYLSDMDRSIPDLIGFIRRFELGAHGTAAVATGLLGNRGRFAVDLRDGWCVMQDRFVVGGFAAVPDGGGTLVAGCGAVRTAGVRRVVPLLFGERAVLRTLGKVRKHMESR
jgi:hypothetical protein